MSGEDCSWEKIRMESPASRCQFVSENCFFSYFSLLKFNYCTIDDHKWLTYILAIIIIILCFYILSSTGGDYLAPALGIISEKLNLSQNLAGLTLLALGNQSPDVIVAFVAGEDQNEGVETSLGSLLGGGFIVVGLVLSSVVFFGNGVNVIPGNYIRDLSVYFLALSYILVLGATEAIQLWESCLFLVFYIIYVVVCFFMDKKKSKEVAESEAYSFLLENTNDEFRVRLFKEGTSKSTTNTESIKDNTKEKEKESITDNKDVSINDIKSEHDTSRDVYTESQVSKGFFDIEKLIKKSYYHRKTKVSNLIKPQALGELKLYSKFRYDLVRLYLNRESEWKKKSLLQKILFIVLDFPLNFLRDLTIPAYEESKWKRTMFIFQPITISLFLIVIFNLYSALINYWVVTLCYFIAMLLLCFVFYRISYRTHLPSWIWLLLASAFVLSILWLWFITNILMDMIVTIKLLFPTNIPQSFISMTLLAFGNSLPDFIVNTSLAKTGYAEMALSGSIGAPVFGMLFGFGISLMKRLIIKSINGEGGSEEFALFVFDQNLNKKLIVDATVCIMTLVICLLICGFAMNFRITKCASIFGYSIYAFFFISIILLTFAIN